MTNSTDLAAGIWPDIEHFLPLATTNEIAKLAIQADRDGRFSEPGLELLRRVGWPGLAVPKRFGGLGATLTECCATQRRLGAADPGLAIAGTMHLGSIGVWAEHYRNKPDMTWVFMEAVATQGLIVASAIAEPSLGGSVTRSTLRARRLEGGYEVTGRKVPLSFAAHANLISLQMQTEATADTASELLVALVARDVPGISSKLSWDTLGMRSSGSDTLLLDKCFIPDPLIVYRGAPGAAADDDIVSGIICFCLMLTSTYFGIAELALKTTSQLLGGMRIEHLGSARAELPSFQNAVGEQVAALLTLEAACAGLAARVEAGVSPQLLLAPALSLKQHAIRVIPEALARLAEVCGGAAYSRSSALERLWRDCQAIRFHPPTPIPVAQYLGRWALGLAASLDLDESSPGLRASAVN
jgi:alkylation response protein AidB-like acyl-CoA dehydrogenase